MKKSLIQGLKEKDMQAVVNTYNLNDFYYPTLFPLKFTPTLTWKTLEAEDGAPVIADVVSYDATAPRKTRRVIERVQGDIQKISIGRDKTESQLNEYYQLLNYARTTDGAQALVDFIYDDVEFCFKGVNGRLEWLALRAMSVGKIVLDSTNNGGIVTETAVDFGIPATNKSGVATIWSNAASATPIANLKAKVKTAKAKGFRLTTAFMDQDTFDNMVATAEVQKAMASWQQIAVNAQAAPDLATVNSYMARNNMPRVVIIDSQVQIENEKGVKTTVFPFETGVVVLTVSPIVGNTWHGPLADEQVEGSVAVKVKRGHVMIKKFSTEEPLKESTVGMANAFPSLSSPKRMFLMDTLNTSWSK